MVTADNLLADLGSDENLSKSGGGHAEKSLNMTASGTLNVPRIEDLIALQRQRTTSARPTHVIFQVVPFRRVRCVPVSG